MSKNGDVDREILTAFNLRVFTHFACNFSLKIFWLDVRKLQKKTIATLLLNLLRFGYFKIIWNQSIMFKNYNVFLLTQTGYREFFLPKSRSNIIFFFNISPPVSSKFEYFLGFRKIDL